MVWEISRSTCILIFSLLYVQEVNTIYTHHQKIVIVDADAGHSKRRIVAFLGGLNLCDGIYDTPEHPIFRTLQIVHADDFHNPTYKVMSLPLVFAIALLSATKVSFDCPPIYGCYH